MSGYRAKSSGRLEADALEVRSPVDELEKPDPALAFGHLDFALRLEPARGYHQGLGSLERSECGQKETLGVRVGRRTGGPQRYSLRNPRKYLHADKQAEVRRDRQPLDGAQE